jgi:hypothetical protein
MGGVVMGRQLRAEEVLREREGGREGGKGLSEIRTDMLIAYDGCCNTAHFVLASISRVAR